MATTLRTVKTATVNEWKAICWADGKIYNSIQYPELEIMDRVGGGDSFASGLIYGLMPQPVHHRRWRRTANILTLTRTSSKTLYQV